MGRDLYWNELPVKTDIVVWIPLSDVQKKIYQMVVDNKSVKDDIDTMDRKHIFVIILALKQLSRASSKLTVACKNLCRITFSTNTTTSSSCFLKKTRAETVSNSPFPSGR